MGTPHDSLFRHVFAVPAHFGALLRSILPGDLVAAVDRTTLTECSGLLVDPRLQKQETDLLFAARRRDRDASIWFLPEHSSTQKRLTALRLRGYSQRLHEKLLTIDPEPRSLPVIVPLVFHHGDQPWRAPTRLSDLVDPVPAGVPVDEFAVLLEDFALRSESELLAADLAPFPALARLHLRSTRHLSPDELEAAMDRWQALIRSVTAPPGERETLEVFHHYVLKVSEMPAQGLAAVMDRIVGPGAGAIVMSTADKLMAKGKAEGRAEGKAEGKAEQLLRQLRRRFGPVPDAVASRVQSAPERDLDIWAERFVDARSLAEVFAAD